MFKITPRVLRRLTTSVAMVAIQHIATMKPKKASKGRHAVENCQGLLCRELVIRPVMHTSDKSRDKRDGSKKLRMSRSESMAVQAIKATKKGPVNICNQTSH